MKIVLSDSFEPLLECKSRYLVLCGGRGSGKSEFAARKVFYRCMTEGRHRFLVMRKVRVTLADSVILVMRRVLAENNVIHDYNKSDRKITFAGPKGMSEIVFEGLDDPEKIKSIAGITSIWIEEATEFSKEDFLKLDLCLREPGPSYHQIMLSFNPQEAEARWLKDRFFGAEPYPDSTVHRSTIDDNPLKVLQPSTWQAYCGTLDALRGQDEALWKISRLGEWASRSGQIYNWDVQTLPPPVKVKNEKGEEIEVLPFDEIWCGGDFGYSVDEAAVARIYRKADEFWVQEVLYQKDLTNQELGAEMKARGINGEAVYFDSAEPKSIAELKKLGLNIRPADKGPDSVRAGIDFIKGKKVHIVQGSSNILKEMNSYCWRKDKSGESLPEPVAAFNHLMDAIRYGIATHCMRPPCSIGYEAN